jgi:pimeloyl-ACP methyl ester carboxylesterase
MRLRPPRGLRCAVVAGAALLALAACTSVQDGSGALAQRPATAPGPTGPPSPSRPTSPSSPGATTVPTIPPAHLADCTSALNFKGFGISSSLRSKLSGGCALVHVPLDYANPGGAKISIQIVKIHDSDDAHPIGSLLLNPGGPGGDGINFAVGLLTELPATILDHFDIVGFDPRGVGLSSPITCLSNSQKDQLNADSPDVLTAAGFADAKADAEELANACNKKYGAALAQYDTVQTAKDMDLIRQAVGDPQLNYLGFSYGTELGSVYAHLFPNTVRVAVLDGAVDPYTKGITGFADQLKGFEDAFDQFAAWCVKQAGCKAVGNPRQAVYALAKQATTSPIPAVGDPRKATSSLVYTGILQALYDQSLWSSLGTALIDAQHGNSAGLLNLADQYSERYSGKYTNIQEADTTISCNDSVPGPTDAQIRATARKWSTEFPIFGLWSAPSLFSCQVWQPVRNPPPLPSAPTPHKVLVLGNLHDPATPYQGAIDLAKAMGNAEVLTWNGEGHTSYLMGSSCIDKDVDNYLVSMTLPPANTTCPR